MNFLDSLEDIPAFYAKLTQNGKVMSSVSNTDWELMA